MAKKKYDEEEGVWRTIGGRRVFIKKGQSLSDAMKESGKFKKTSEVTREDYHKQNKSQISSDAYDKYYNSWDDEKGFDKKASKEYTKAQKEVYNYWENFDEPKEYDGDISKLKGKHIGIEQTKEWKQAGKEVDEMLKAEKDRYKATKHEGFGDYNDDYIPVYDNKIDYSGDFSRANLSKVSNKDLTEALNKQSELYHEAMNENLGDQRTRNGKMNKIFNTAKTQKYEGGMKALNEEIDKRGLPRYNIYNANNNMILASSPTKEMAERELAEMYETDKKLQKQFGWKELPQYYMTEDSTGNYKKEMHLESIKKNAPVGEQTRQLMEEMNVRTFADEIREKEILEKHNLKDNDPEFKRAMLGRMESDVNYYLGNGNGYAGHLWAKDEDEQIEIMKALYNTLPEKEKPDWISREKIEDYAKKMNNVKDTMAQKTLSVKYKGTYDYLKSNTTLSETEILELLKKIEKDKK